MTRVEVLVALVVLCVLIAIAIVSATRPAVSLPQAKRGACWATLRENGVNFSLYREEYGGKYPWQLSGENGGSLEHLETPNSAFYHYKAMSNYAVTWRLTCPQDDRVPARSWDNFSNSNLSYFVVTSVSSSETNLVLAGDRCLQTTPAPGHGFVSIATNSSVVWAKDFHGNRGWLLFTDGSATLTSNNVRDFFFKSSREVHRLAIP